MAPARGAHWSPQRRVARARRAPRADARHLWRRPLRAGPRVVRVVERERAARAAEARQPQDHRAARVERGRECEGKLERDARPRERSVEHGDDGLRRADRERRGRSEPRRAVAEHAAVGVVGRVEPERERGRPVEPTRRRPCRATGASAQLRPRRRRRRAPRRAA